MSTVLAAVPPVRANAPAGRHDIYALIHKALRAALTDAMLAVGRLDAADPQEVSDTVVRLNDLLDLCQDHLNTEETLVHPALEARRPGSTLRIADEHEQHVAAIAQLRQRVAALARAPAGTRDAVAATLYRELALFAGENFVHMHHEEVAHNAVLWDAYTDAELVALEDSIKAHHPPPAMRRALRWMLPTMTPAQRAGMLAGMRAGAPAHLYRGALELARTYVDPDGWRKLEAALAA